MAVPANIEVFNQVAARTFVRLYEAFPSPIDLDPMLIGMDVILEEKYEPDSAQHSFLVSSASDTIKYLIDEGFIRLTRGYQDLGFRGVKGAVLTSKGFALLQNAPESIDSSVDRRSYFERLKAATASGVKAITSDAVGALVARLLSGG